MTEITDRNLAELRKPFAPEHISKMPRGGRGDNTSCRECGGWHKPGAVHLDFVGHANVTARLLNVDPEWTWEPCAFDERGLPALVWNSQGAPIGLWIKLTVLGVTRYGYGSCEPGKFDAVKELIGDAIRNAAMRFGVALDLWAKGELETATEEVAGSEQSEPTAADKGQVAPATLAAPPDSRARGREDKGPNNPTPATASQDSPDTPPSSGSPSVDGVSEQPGVEVASPIDGVAAWQAIEQAVKDKRIDRNRVIAKAARLVQEHGVTDQTVAWPSLKTLPPQILVEMEQALLAQGAMV